MRRTFFTLVVLALRPYTSQSRAAQEPRWQDLEEQAEKALKEAKPEEAGRLAGLLEARHRHPEATAIKRRGCP